MLARLFAHLPSRRHRHRRDVRFSRRTQHPPPWEFFPIWCGNKSPGAIAIDFFGDGRGPRIPIASTVPIGYEMPKPQMKAPPEITPSGAAPVKSCRAPGLVSASARIITTPARWRELGHWHSVPVNAELMQRGQQRFNITCSVLPWIDCGRQRNAKQYGLKHGGHSEDERIRKMADGEIFNTITNGKTP